MKRIALLFSVACLVAGLSVPGWAAQGQIIRVSVSNTGRQGDRNSYGPSLSANGRWIGFSSDATNLVPGDHNGTPDAYVRDLRRGRTHLVSVSSSGKQGNDWSGGASVSASGRWVVFTSLANNLVPDDDNDTDGNINSDVFVRDLRTATTRLVSVSSSGAQGRGPSYFGSISANGRWVVFTSQATNLVPNDANGEEPDVFVHDLRSGETKLVSVNSLGKQANGASFVFPDAISTDGHLVAFESEARNLVAGDHNGQSDIFVRNLRTGRTELVSVSSSGEHARDWSSYAALSAGGRRVAFYSAAENLVRNDNDGQLDVFVRDLRTHTTKLVSVSSTSRPLGDQYSCCPSISPNGKWVGFQSFVPRRGNDDRVDAVFVHDMRRGTTTLVSRGSSASLDDESGTASLSNRSVAFESYIGNLVRGDTNHSNDVFVRALSPPLVH
jgi:Tol biopolymer transport system component